MKPAPFEYHAPETLDDALALLARGDGARVLAGGQSLVPLMKARFAKPGVIVDINRVAGLDGIEERDGVLDVGALVRQQDLLESDAAARAQPLLREAGRHAGYLATRHRGTVGGSIAYAAPWAELTAAAVALDATIEARSTRGERAIAARSFFHGPHETGLEPDELITGISFPAQAPRTGVGFHEVSARYRDYAQLAAAAVVTLDAGGACATAELVLLRVAPAPHRADIAALLRGRQLDESALDEVAQLLATLEPADDIEVSGTYRRRVAPVLAGRALRDAAARAREAA